MIRSILIEVRPQIGVCNIYILFKNLYNCINITSSNNNIQIEYVEKNGGPSIIKNIILDDNINLNGKTLSMVQNNKKSIILRIQMNPSIGSFISQVLPFQNLKTESGVRSEINPPFKVGQECDLKCICCEQSVLKKEIVFNRVLPLPQNGSLELGDLFCHIHHGDTDEELPSTEPRNHDCLYGNAWFMINSENINIKKIRRFDDSRAVYCSRCLSWIGTFPQLSRNIIKLWNSSVNVDMNSREHQALIDFQLIINQAIEDSLGSICKISLFYYTNKNECQFLLIWIVDKNLQTYFTKSESIQLQIKNVKKLLYSYESKESNSLVQIWSKDLNVQNIEISKQIFTSGLQHLLYLSQFIPKPYDKVDVFKVACLGLDVL